MLDAAASSSITSSAKFRSTRNSGMAVSFATLRRRRIA
jgi:hypothetical protein